MLILPEEYQGVHHEWEKIYNYLILWRAGCPVLKSAVLLPGELIDNNLNA